MTILVLADKLYPTPNANSICLKRIMDEFEKSGHRILIVNRSIDERITDRKENVVNFFQPIDEKWERSDSIWKKITYIFHRVLRLQRWPRVQTDFTNKYLNSINQLTPIDEVDVILSLCHPYESVEAGYILKIQYPFKKWIIYNIDTVSDSSMSKIDRLLCCSIKKKALKWELNMFSAADLIVSFKSHQVHYSNPNYREISHKMIFQDVPLFEPERFVGSRDHGRDTIKIIYAGKFYPRFRDPRILIGLFCGLKTHRNYEVSVYTTFDFVSYLNDSGENNGDILAHSYVEEHELNSHLVSSDFLLSIGNSDSNMFPSKIVTYVSYGKPIIHIYQDEKDPVVSYLEAYPDKLLIDYRGDVENNKNKIANYIEGKHHSIDKKDLIIRYMESSPSYNTNQILSRL